MFYRRKLILSLLQEFNNELPKINFYKLALILTKRQQKPDYDFVPYKYGCYSFSLHADLIAMQKKGIVNVSETKIEKKDNINYLITLSPIDKKILTQLRNQFDTSCGDDLMKYTYIRFPQTAINSLTAERILSPEQLKVVKDSISNDIEPTLFTIGYEGVSLENYLNRLILNNIKLLIDVRRNPLSMKFGFSKNQLKSYCKSLNIDYIHIPEVGIASNKRQMLNSQNDYDILFEDYKKTTLTETRDQQYRIINLVMAKMRVAITCFESDICQCHRKHLAENIMKQPGINFSLKHI